MKDLGYQKKALPLDSSPSLNGVLPSNRMLGNATSWSLVVCEHRIVKENYNTPLFKHSLSILNKLFSKPELDSTNSLTTTTSLPNVQYQGSSFSAYQDIRLFATRHNMWLHVLSIVLTQFVEMTKQAQHWKISASKSLHRNRWIRDTTPHIFSDILSLS